MISALSSSSRLTALESDRCSNSMHTRRHSKFDWLECGVLCKGKSLVGFLLREKRENLTQARLSERIERELYIVGLCWLILCCCHSHPHVVCCWSNRDEKLLISFSRVEARIVFHCYINWRILNWFWIFHLTHASSSPPAEWSLRILLD